MRQPAVPGCARRRLVAKGLHALERYSLALPAKFGLIAWGKSRCVDGKMCLRTEAFKSPGIV